MDLVLVGRHALLFDDDATAGIVNYDDALVEWHSLQIDRYDVRHLLSAPPPPRRRNRNPEPIFSEDPFLESQLDHERYLDLHMLSEVEGDENIVDEGDYRAVAFSYGENDDLADQNKKDTEMEGSGFLPPFPIPGHLLQCLPSTEKVHQIIARTAIFVRKHGGQSEIVLRVKQGDNPTFGFLMPDHHLHSYFRFLVEHPELLHSDCDAKSQEFKNLDGKHLNTNVGGALSLLGSAYESGEEEDDNDNAKSEKKVSEDSSTAVNHSFSHVSKMENNMDVVKDVSVSKNTTSSIKEKVLSVKNNSVISASKSGGAKGIKKESKSGSLSAASENAKSSTLEITSKIEPIILEPPPEFKSLIDKLVEFVMRNGKQFEETLIEQDTKHGRFPFLRPSDQYHPYYLKALQTAQESRTNGKCFYSGKDDLVGFGIDRKAIIPKKKESSSMGSYVGDMPLESDMKEKFKMVIGKSKKETQDTQPKGTQQECGITVDAAAAAAILQSAIKGGNKSIARNNILNAGSHANHSKANNPKGFGSLMPLQMQNAGRGGSSRTSPEAAREADNSESHFTEEQKVKAERLKRAKLFVAMLRSGVPSRSETICGPSVNHLESGVSRSASEVNITQKEREGSLAPADIEMYDTVEKPERICFGDEHGERLARRKYRSRPGGFEDDAEDKKKHAGVHLVAKHRSRSRRHGGGDENENTEKMEQKPNRRRHQSYCSSEENENEGHSEEDMEHELSKMKHLPHHSHHEGDEHDYKDKGSKDQKWSQKKHQSHYSSRKRRHSSKKCSDEEYAHDDDGRDRKHSQKKHCSHRSSEHSREKNRHSNKHSSRDKESRRHHTHESSSNTLHQNDSSSDKRKKELYNERDELEEGEISSRVSEEFRGIASDRVSRETSINALSSNRREPSENVAEVPDDLRAKIRAMLMATRL